MAIMGEMLYVWPSLEKRTKRNGFTFEVVERKECDDTVLDILGDSLREDGC